MSEIVEIIPDIWATCPSWWKNFVHANGLFGSRTDAYERVFAEWNVKYIDMADDENDGNGICYFEDEKSHMWFMLKWNP